MKNLTKAMLAVMAECPYVLKASVPGLNYTIAREADFLRVVRPAMLKHGIAFFVVAVEPVHRENFTTAKGTPMTSTAMKMTGKFVHAESGEEQTVEAIGEGMDSGDKGYPKAHTIALKYCLRQSLLVETGDDPDLERPEDTPPPVAPPPAPKPPVAAPKVESLPPAAVDAREWAPAMEAVVNAYMATYKPGEEKSWPSLANALYAAGGPRHPRKDDITKDEAIAMIAKLAERAAKNNGANPMPEALGTAFAEWEYMVMQMPGGAK